MPLPGVSHWMLACLWVAAVLLGLPEAQAVSEIVRNYYDVLKVEPAATDRQIKKAFHQLALKYHPDRNKSSDAERAFREIAEAYEVLSDKEKRRQYDEWGHEAFLQQDFFNPEDAYDEPFFSFDYVFDMFDDDDPFLEEPYYRWTVPQDVDDQDNHFEHWGTDFFDPEDYPGWG